MKNAFFIGKKIKRKTTVDPLFVALIIILGFLAIIAYRLRPIVENDLFRYYAWSQDFAQNTYIDFIKGTRLDSQISFSLFWLAGKTGALGLIPMITVIIVYGIVFGVIYDAGKTLKISNKIILQYCLFAIALLQFGPIASNVRNVTAFAIVICAAYRDLFKKKKDALTLFLYLIPCGIHIAAAIFILARVALPIYKRFRFLGIFAMLFAPIFVVQLYQVRYVFSRITYLVRLIEKAYYYFFSFGNLEWLEMVKNSGFEQIKKLFFCLVTLLCFFLTCYVSKCVRKKSNLQYNISLYTEITLALTLMSMYIPVPTYFRFSIPMIILFSLPFFLLQKYSSERYGVKIFLYIGYFDIVIMGIVTQIYQFYFNFRI